MNLNKTFIGRQPILDENGKVFGYELLFRRSALTNKAEIDDPFKTVIETFINALEHFGIDALVGKGVAFVNVNKDVIMSPIVELLPSNRVILEILEDVIVDESLLDRIEELRLNGYMFALDDFTMNKTNIESLKN
ncbi:hypothetical protein OWM07_07975 [Deferribacter thermophilus]|uniref:hypothetical protein n=1 Tax=Deferribacter thermophilus TaxID=53573 RepID=UPI003C2854CF